MAPKVGFVRGKACEPFTSGMVSEVKHLSLFPSLVNLGMSLAWSRAQRKKKKGRDECEDHRRRKEKLQFASNTQPLRCQTFFLLFTMA